MGSQPEQRGGKPAAGPGVPVQRQEEDHVPVRWLRSAEHKQAADTVDRLAADFDLVTDLGLRRFEGPDYDYFATELARYGMAVISAWMGQGLIFARCRDRGFGGLPVLDRPFTEDEITELTGETVAKALNRFREGVLMTQKWDYRKGASLRTYFVGQCLIRFANIYRQWWEGEERNRLQWAEDDVLDALLPKGDDPAGRTVDRIVADAALQGVRDPRVRRAMVLTGADWTQQQIAQTLGVTEKAVERMLSNERGRLRRRAG
jgi:hypothetical protein